MLILIGTLYHCDSKDVRLLVSLITAEEGYYCSSTSEVFGPCENQIQPHLQPTRLRSGLYGGRSITSIPFSSNHSRTK